MNEITEHGTSEKHKGIDLAGERHEKNLDLLKY